MDFKKTISYLKELPRLLGGWLFVVQWILTLQVMFNFSNFIHLLYLTIIIDSIKPIALIEMTLSAIQGGGAAYLVIIFFRRKKSFINLWFYFLILGIVLDIASFFNTITFLTPEQISELNLKPGAGILKAIGYFIVWGTYIKKSKQVKETFVF